MDKAGMEPAREGRTGDALRGAAEGAKQELSRLGDEVKDRSASAFHEQRDVASRQIQSVANAFEAGAGSFDEDGQPRLASYTREAAERIRRLSDNVRERDFNTVVDDVREYARENPAVVIGGAAVLGLVLSRFLKSSSSRVHDDEDKHTGYRTHSTEAREPIVSEPPIDTATTSYEGMAPGVSPIGESARVEDTGRRFGDGTES